MNPKTSTQKEVYALHQSLPPFLSDKECEYAKIRINKVARYSVYRLRKNSLASVLCGGCDEKYTVPQPIKDREVFVCPHCGYKSKVLKFNSNYRFVAYYYLTTTYIKEYQVLRYWIVKKRFYWNKPSEFEVEGECYQLWINTTNGKVVIMARPIACFSFDKWIFQEPMTIKPNPSSDASWKYTRYDSMAAFTCQPLKIHPLLRKRGITSLNKMGKLSPLEIIFSALDCSSFETLLKAKQYSILSALSLSDIKGFWRQIKIALRKGYKLSSEDWKLWRDMLVNLRYLGKDICSPYYLCPDDLKKAHDKYLKKAQDKQSEESLLKAISENNPNYIQSKGMFFGVVIADADNRLVIEPLRSIREFYEEGQAMHHCVYTNRYYNLENSLCLSCKDKDGNRIATIEMSIPDFDILQCRGPFNNKPKEYHHIIGLIEDHKKEFVNCMR